MADQGLEKVNGVGKLAMAGKKRRKGQDLQPIRTAPPQQSGIRGSHISSTTLGQSQTLNYPHRYGYRTFISCVSVF